MNDGSPMLPFILWLVVDVKAQYNTALVPVKFMPNIFTHWHITHRKTPFYVQQTHSKYLSCLFYATWLCFFFFFSLSHKHCWLNRIFIANESESHKNSNRIIQLKIWIIPTYKLNIWIIHFEKKKKKKW